MLYLRYKYLHYNNIAILKNIQGFSISVYLIKVLLDKVYLYITKENIHFAVVDLF